MTNEAKERAIRWLTEEVRSLRLAPSVNGCEPGNWAESLEVMETCLEAVRAAEVAGKENRTPTIPAISTTGNGAHFSVSELRTVLTIRSPESMSVGSAIRQS